MEESKGQERVEEWIRSSSKGETGHEVEAEATKGLTLLKLHKGFVLCDFLVHYGVSEAVEVEGKAMAEKGRMTSVRVEVRTKHERQMVALGITWVAHAPPKNSAHQLNKSISPKL